MRNAIELIRQVIARKVRPWTFDGQAVNVQLPPNERTQRITIEQDTDQIVFRSTVLGRSRVTQNHRRWRDLVRQAWLRNATHDVVTFAFDRSDRLIGVIRHPAATLDCNELVLYIDTLARECDRFEYVLTGEDVS